MAQVRLPHLAQIVLFESDGSTRGERNCNTLGDSHQQPADHHAGLLFLLSNGLEIGQ